MTDDAGEGSLPRDYTGETESRAPPFDDAEKPQVMELPQWMMLEKLLETVLLQHNILEKPLEKLVP